jgi:hypothetical protein
MSHTVTIYGASDDLIEVSGDAPGCDEFCGENAVIVVHGADETRTRVHLVYHSDGFPGLWAITLGPTDDGMPMLPCTVDLSTRYDDSPGYSARAVFEGVERVVVQHEPDGS